MKPDEQAIRALHSTWIEAVNAGDLACLLGLMAEDCVLLNPGGEPAGREAFAGVFQAAHQTAAIRCVSDLEEVVVVGEVAYTRSRDSLSVTPRGDSTSSGQAPSTSSGQVPSKGSGQAAGDAAHFAGHRLTVYRKQPDGRWLLARDAHTLTEVRKPK